VAGMAGVSALELQMWAGVRPVPVVQKSQQWSDVGGGEPSPGADSGSEPELARKATSTAAEDWWKAEGRGQAGHRGVDLLAQEVGDRTADRHIREWTNECALV
jgi:hypothetical protein